VVYLLGTIIDIIEKETDGKRFKSHKYCNDNIVLSNIEYDDFEEVVWKNYGETVQHKNRVNLKQRADFFSNKKSIFTYFLDGSRHTYKIDDISYNKNVYPIIAGQIGIGCCRRNKKEVSPEQFTRKLVIVLPDIAYRDGWGADIFFADVINKINSSDKMKKYFRVKFDSILTYKRDKDDKLENKGIAVIQDYMIELEKIAVSDLVIKGKLNQDNFLIKDGSLEYKVVSDNNLNLRNQRVANFYKYVIGVSKSFDPTKCLIKGGGTNSDIIADLKPFERTPVYMYQSKIAGDVYFAIWYLRLRDSKYTHNVFDGVVKVEKLVIGNDEQEKGLDSEIIDHISSHLLNERNPVCYGSDIRWANHIYPIYLTELYIKSKYMSNELFLQLF
jgi:hypothetical protein